MASLVLVRKGWFSRDFRVVDHEGRQVAVVHHKQSGEPAELTIQGILYKAYCQEAWGRNDYVLAENEKIIARATMGSFSKWFEIDYAGRRYEVERDASWFGKGKVVVREKDNLLGSVKTRTSDLSETIPLVIRIFMIWLAKQRPSSPVSPGMPGMPSP